MRTHKEMGLACVSMCGLRCMGVCMCTYMVTIGLNPAELTAL